MVRKHYLELTQNIKRCTEDETQKNQIMPKIFPSYHIDILYQKKCNIYFFFYICRSLKLSIVRSQKNKNYVYILMSVKILLKNLFFLLMCIKNEPHLKTFKTFFHWFSFIENLDWPIAGSYDYCYYYFTSKLPIYF